MKPVGKPMSARTAGKADASVVCLALALVVALGLAAPSTASRAAMPVTLATFGAEPPPLFRIAAHHRLFEKFGVSVRVEPRWTSKELREGLSVGTFTFVQSLLDNAVAVQEDLGVAVVILMPRGGGGGVDLVVQSHVQRVEDLRGRTILVDSPDTGHALALRKILKDRGLLAGRDYTMLPLGQTQKRFEAMKVNVEYAGTMAPFSAEAKRLGFRSLGHAPTLVGDYDVGGVYGRREWVEAHREATVGFLAGYLHARRWVVDPANKAAVLEALGGGTSARSEEQYARVVAGNEESDPEFDLKAFRNGLALRAEIQGTWGGTPPPAERYYDFTHLASARALLDRTR
jgi:NitT/TauT family transport system substrate-binding protein